MNQKTKKLNEENNRLDEQILPENQEAFTDIICYLRGSNIPEYHIEVVRQDLTEMVLSAQERGETIQSVFGDDYKQFCDDIIENLPPKTKMQKLLETMDMVCLVLSILFAINIVISEDMIFLIQSLIQKEDVNWNISVSSGSLISIVFIILLANLTVNSIIKNAFNKKIKHKKTLAFFVGAGFMLALVIIGWLGKSILFSINIFVACALAVALYAGHKLLESC